MKIWYLLVKGLLIWFIKKVLFIAFCIAVGVMGIEFLQLALGYK